MSGSQYWSDAVQSRSSLPDHVSPPATWGIARCKLHSAEIYSHVFHFTYESGDKATTTNRPSANAQYHKKAQIHS